VVQQSAGLNVKSIPGISLTSEAQQGSF